MNEDNTYVTKPILPDLENFIDDLKSIWKSSWLTNNGIYHQKLEKELCQFLGVKQCSLTSNGTLALMIALTALNIKGEVITTPFSFVATTNVLQWLGIKPVFCDIEGNTLNMNPQMIEALITENTSAILPVHIYGNPCNVEAIDKIAKTHNLKVVYDGAQAFDVKLKGKPIVNFGDLSILSFHATKVFNTLEGGAIIANKHQLKKKIDLLKNFGIVDEFTTIEAGINAKMNEIQAAFGLRELKMVRQEIKKRKIISEYYRQSLKNLDCISMISPPDNVQYNYSYMPILVSNKAGKNIRDQIYNRLKKMNIHTRKYFYPLISQLPMYQNLPSSSPENLPIANQVSKEVLCLPIFGDLDRKIVDKICNIITESID